MSTTMNGYVRIDTLDSRLVLVRGTRLLGGAAAALLAEVARRFEAEVELIATFNGWRSATLNAASGGIGNSNHLSGTAVDINGGKHPRYRHGTFTPAQTAAIRRIVADLGGAVRWGGEWGSDVDEMHFEIVGTAANAQAVANRITTPAPITVPSIPTAPIPSIPEDDDMYSDQDRADAAETLRLLRLIVLAPSGGATPLTQAEVKYVQLVQGDTANASEARRMGGVLLGAIPPVGAERTIRQQIGA